jgi:hypothetical protein
MKSHLLVLTLAVLESLVSSSTFSPARPPAIPLAGRLLVKIRETCLIMNSQISVYEYLA